MARILAVDDSEQSLALIELGLHAPEFEVVTAKSGGDALARAYEQDFDLILLDALMPAPGGFDLRRRLADDPRTAAVPMILLSTRARDEVDKAQGPELGAVDYLTKPVERQELITRVRAMLRLAVVRADLERRIDEIERTLREERDALHALEHEREILRETIAANAQRTAPAHLLLDAHGRVLARDEAFTRVFGALPLGCIAAEAGAPALARLLAAASRAPLREAERWFEVERHRLEGDPLGAAALVTIHDVTLAEAARQRRAEREPLAVATAASHEPAPYSISGFVGRGAALRPLVTQVDRLRHGRSTTLIHGASGTGKELVARALHYDGPYAHRPFIPIHCGAISEELIESELFGHEKGAFTGAQSATHGLFAAADGGTIFLDEIAETGHALQVKLLRVLQFGEVRRVGATQPLRVDVRIVAATNQDLLARVRDGRFREDLYYRLEVVTLSVPPLTARLDDLPLLVEHFLARFNVVHERKKRPVRAVSTAVMRLLERYPWPGNVRELENVIDRAFALGCGEVIQKEDLPERVLLGRPTLASELAPREAEVEIPRPPSDLRAELEEQERAWIRGAIGHHEGDKMAAAKTLGMSKSTFYRRLKELGIEE